MAKTLVILFRLPFLSSLPLPERSHDYATSLTMCPSLFFLSYFRLQLEDKCKSSCVSYLTALKACEDRVKKDTTGEAHCTGQNFDYWKCLDSCVAPKLFAKLR